jgi:hypothetical protein
VFGRERNICLSFASSSTGSTISGIQDEAVFYNGLESNMQSLFLNEYKERGWIVPSIPRRLGLLKDIREVRF